MTGFTRGGGGATIGRMLQKGSGTKAMAGRALMVLTSLVLTAPPALAQSRELVSRKSGAEESVMIEWLIGAVFLIGCLVVAFKPAKRSNLQ